MEQYFSEKPQVESETKQISTTIRGNQWTLTTDSGVFSKKSVDFGTRLLIESVEIKPSDSILDLGCGYGVVGIVLAHELTNGHVTLVDVNQRALNLAKINCKRYNLKNVNIIKSDGFSELSNKQWQHIVTNPPIRAGKKLMHTWFEQALHHLLPGGSLWIVIQKKQGAPSAIKKLQSCFVEVEEVNKKAGYYIIRAHNS